MDQDTFAIENPTTDWHAQYYAWRKYVEAHNQFVADNLPEVVFVRFDVLSEYREAKYNYQGISRPKPYRELDYPWDYPSVYIIRRHDRELLYIGFSTNPSKRMRQHLTARTDFGSYLYGYKDKLKYWWVEIRPVRSKKEGLALEAKLIDKYQPHFNLAGAL